MTDKNTSYWLPASDIRSNQKISSLDPLTRGIYRDLLDLMWLTNSQCTLPAKYDVLAERLNTTDKVIKKAIRVLSSGEYPLISLDKTPQGEYLISEFLRLQKGGVEKPDYIAERKAKTDYEVPEIKLDNDIDPYVNRRYIEAEEAFANDKFTEWMPTSRFISNGEAYVITPKARENIAANAPDANLDLVFSRAFLWLMEPRNETKRPTYANMMNFLIGFAKRATKKKVSPLYLQEQNTNAAMSDDDFEAEIAALLGKG